MVRGIRTALLAVTAVLLGSLTFAVEDEAEAARGEKVDGYAEWRLGDCLIARRPEGLPCPRLQVQGRGEATDFASIPLGVRGQGEGQAPDRRHPPRPRDRGQAERLGDVRGRRPGRHRPGREPGAAERPLRRGQGRAWAGLIETRPPGRPRPPHRGQPPPALPPPRGRPDLRHREQGVERLRDGQLLHLRLHRPPRRHGRRRGGDRPRPRARAREPRALAQAVQARHVGPAPDPRGPRRHLHHRRRQEAGDRGAGGPGREHRLQERLRARDGGPGRPRRPALRLRGGVRHHEGARASGTDSPGSTARGTRS